MSGGKKKSRPVRWVRSLFKRNGGSSSRSEGQALGTSSPVMNSTFGSAMSLRPRSSQDDSRSPTPAGLAPISAHNSHGANLLGTTPVTPEGLPQSEQKETPVSENPKTNPRDSLATQQDEVSLHEGKSHPSHVGCSFNQY